MQYFLPKLSFLLSLLNIPSLLLFLPPLSICVPPSISPQFYRKPLLARTTTSQVILGERDINTVFYRTEDLVDLHTALHEKLEPQLRDWTVNTCVGDFFVELVRERKTLLSRSSCKLLYYCDTMDIHVCS